MRTLLDRTQCDILQWIISPFHNPNCFVAEFFFSFFWTEQHISVSLYVSYELHKYSATALFWLVLACEILNSVDVIWCDS